MCTCASRNELTCPVGSNGPARPQLYGTPPARFPCHVGIPEHSVREARRLAPARRRKASQRVLLLTGNRQTRLSLLRPVNRDARCRVSVAKASMHDRTPYFSATPAVAALSLPTAGRRFCGFGSTPLESAAERRANVGPGPGLRPPAGTGSGAGRADVTEVGRMIRLSAAAREGGRTSQPSG